tara:strand:- start:428 stop:1357 length:930 start_codon:yes stop_codon:yes gene_type:complete
MEKKLRLLGDVLGEYYRVNEEYLFYCPYCRHHKRKFSINVSKGVYKCWVCDVNGRNLRRIVRRFGTFYQRKEWEELDGRVDLNIFDKIFEEEPEEEQQIIKLPKEFTSLANKGLPLAALPALNYLGRRKIFSDDILRWKIGYCASGEYAGRVLVPSFNEDGHVNYFVARSYDNNWKKYKNPPASRDIIFNDLYVDWTSDLSIVEGVFDAIVAGGNSIPLLGSSLRVDSNLFQKIVKNDTPIYVALDPDAEKKALNLIKNLLTYGVELYKVDITPFSDVGEMTKEEYRKRKDEALPMTEDSYLLYQAMNL